MKKPAYEPAAATMQWEWLARWLLIQMSDKERQSIIQQAEGRISFYRSCYAQLNDNTWPEMLEMWENVKELAERQKEQP